MQAATLRNQATPGQPVVDPSLWIGDELDRKPHWRVQVDPGEFDQLSRMASALKVRIGGNPNGLLSLEASAFDLGAFAAKVDGIRRELKEGTGAVLIRGLRMDVLDTLDAAIIYWAIGRHLGAACSNNPQGDMLGHVTDLGKTQKDPNSRGYQTREELNFHCDQSSIVGLLCVRTAKSGGISKITSSVAVYNELLRLDAECAEALSQSLCWSKHGEANPGEPGFYESPVFNFYDGMLCTSFGPTHITKGHQIAGAPPLTQLQRKGIELVKSISEKLHYAMPFQPGDIQLLNNAVVFHSRTEYEDWPDPAKKRLLYRLWLIEPDIRPLTPYVMQWKAGVKLRNTKERIVL